MVPPDPVPPQPDETRVSDPSERDRLLAATLADAAMRDARYSQAPVDPSGAPTLWKWLLSLVVLATAAWVLAFPPAWLVGPPLPALSPPDVERGLEASLFLQAVEVEVFRHREGRLPRTLDEVGGEGPPGIAYVRSGNRAYQLVARRPDGTAVVWDSAHEVPARSRLARRWLGAGRLDGSTER